MAMVKAAAGRRSAFVIRPLPCGGGCSGVEATPDPHDHHAESDEPAHPDYEGHQTLGNGAIAAQRGSSPVVGITEVLDVRRDLVGLLVGDGLLAEHRHLAGSD